MRGQESQDLQRFKLPCQTWLQSASFCPRIPTLPPPHQGDLWKKESLQSQGMGLVTELASPVCPLE